MGLTLGTLQGDYEASKNTGTQISLGDIANGFLASLAGSAASGVSNIIDSKTRAQTTAPAPDLAAAAARPAVSSFMDSSALGVSLPILLIGAGALVFLIARR